MKKCFSFLLTISMLLSLFAGCASDETVRANPTSDFTYIIFHDYIIIESYIGTSPDVVIPEEIKGLQVKMIADAAFGLNELIETVTIPSTVEEIGDMAFKGCSNLHTVNLEIGLKEIEPEAFRNCKKLKNITLPSGLTEIGSRAFGTCESLSEINIPKTTEIGMRAFEYSGLTSVVFEDGIETIGTINCFFSSKKLRSVTIPASVKKVNAYMFLDTLEEVHFLGDAPETVGKEPFGKNAIIYYNEGTSGWDDTELSQYNTIKVKEQLN